MPATQTVTNAYTNTLLLFIFCAAIVVSGNHAVRYKLIEPVLELAQFPGNLDQWTQIGEPTNANIQGREISLQSSRVGAIGGLYRKFPLVTESYEPNQVMRVTGRIIRTVDDPDAINLTLDQGTIAALDFALDDEGGRQVHILHDITHGQSDTAIDKVVPIPNPAKAVSLEFLHREAVDSATATDFQIQRLSQRSTYVWSIVPIIGLGFLLLHQLVKSVLGNFSVARLLGLLSGAIILIILLLPEMQGIVANAYRALQQTSWGSRLPASFDIFSAGHLLMFTVVTLLAWSLAASFQQARLLTLFQILLITIASEGAQQHIAGRTASMADLEYNLLGIVIGTILYALLSTYFSSRETKPSQVI